MSIGTNERKWGKRTRTKNILTVILPILLLVTLISLAIFLKPRNVCKTDTCEKLATRLINRIDTTANPCEDFYQFACGNTLKAGNPTNELTYVKAQKTENLLRLYKQSIKESEHKTIRISKKLFKKCLNQDEMEQDNLRRIREVINEVGDWSALDWTWLQATYKLRDLGYPFSIFLNVKVVRNKKDFNKFVLEVEKADIPNKGSIMNKYPRHEVAKIMVKIATLTNAGNETSSLEEIEHVLDFNNLLSIDFNEYEWKQLTIEQFQEEYNKIASVPFDWLEFLSKIVGKQVKLFSIDYVSFLKSDSLDNWINLISTSSKKTVANYMIWKVIETQLPYLPETVRQAAKYKINETREMFCLEECEKRFPVSPISIAYAREALSPEKRQSVEKLFEEIKSQFLEKIEKTKWIAANDKSIIKEQANSAVLVYGLPGDYSSDKMLDSLDVDFMPTKSDSLLDLLAQATRNDQTLLYKQLNVLRSDNIINRIYFRDRKVYSVLLYKTFENEFYIPIEWACYLQEDVPNYGKYLPLGMLMYNFFYLLMMGFDYELLSLNKISKDTQEAGNDMMECLQEQIENQTGYESFVISNGLQTGIAKTLSYQAYEKIQAHGEEQKLPGLNYTPRQLFWILSTYCHIPDPKLGSRTFNLVGFYANTTLISNFNNMQFAKDFNCSMESKTNPLNKCEPFFVF